MKISIFNIIKNYKIRSLFMKYWLTIFITILIPCLALSYFKSVYNIQIARKETSSTALFSSEKIKRSLETVLSSVESQWISLSSDDYVQMFLSKSELENNLISSRTFMHMHDMAGNYIRTNDYIDSLYIYNLKNGYVFSTTNSNSFENFYDTNWHSLWKEKGNYISYRNTNILGTDHAFLTVCRNIYYEEHIEGVLVVNISTSKLTEMLLAENEKTVFYITAEDGSIVYSNNTDSINSHITDHQEIKDFRAKDLLGNEQLVQWDGNKLLCRVSSSSTGLKIFTVFSFANRDTYSAYNSQDLLWFVIIIFILSFIVSYTITRKIYSSILQIINVLQNPYSEIPENKNSATNELNFIMQHIIGMFKRNSQVENELTQKLELLKNAQSIALYTQINPHFLFNTLQLINTIHMSTYKQETEITRIITLLSDILSITLDTRTYLVPLRTEIEYLKKYAEILSIRYDNMFTITFDIEEDALDFSVVKFSLQPILENSVQHGILPLRKNGKIKISAFTQKQNLIIKIYDNGSEIPEEKLDTLRKLLSDGKMPEKNSIGLLNVHHRIRLLFGDEYGCSIDSDEQGTVVTLTMKKTKSKLE